MKEQTALEVAVKKITEYETLIKQGVLIRIPCFLDDTVQVKMTDGSFEQGCCIGYTHNKAYGFCAIIKSKAFGEISFPFSEFGKTVFLVRKEK